MFATLLTAALIIAPALHTVSAEFAMQVPELSQCKNARITWSATTGPYNLIIVPSNDTCGGDIIDDLGDHNGTSMTWKVTQPAGSKLVFSLEDAKGEEAWSGEVVVQKSDDTSCLKNLISTPNAASLPTAPAATTASGGVPNAGAPVAAAAGALNQPSSGAISIRQFSTPAMVIAALFAAVAIAL